MSGHLYMICEETGRCLLDNVPEEAAPSEARRIANERQAAVLLILYTESASGSPVPQSQVRIPYVASG